MTKYKTKVCIYTRVSTTMQIDGFSLEAQKTRMKALCDYNDLEIVGEYEDAGKSGKSIVKNNDVSFLCTINHQKRAQRSYFISEKALF